MASPFNTSSIPHHTPLKNKGLQAPHSTASSAKVHDTRQPHEPHSSPHTQTGSYNPQFAVVPQRHCLNPRSRMGSDEKKRPHQIRMTMFQSMLPHTKMVYRIAVVCTYDIAILRTISIGGINIAHIKGSSDISSDRLKCRMSLIIVYTKRMVGDRYLLDYSVPYLI